MKVRSQNRGAWPRLMVIVAIMGALAAGGGQSAFGGEGVILVNQHPTPEPAAAECTYSVSCSPTVDPPFEEIANGSNTVDLFSYHIRPLPNSSDFTKGAFCQATCKYKYIGTYQSRAKILSDDWSYTPEAVQAWITRVCQAGKNGYPGRLHFEHYDNETETTLVDAGRCIGGYTSWGPEAQEIIDDYAHHDLVQFQCPSILGPNGQIHRGGLNKDRLLWKGAGANPPDNFVTLVAFGSMGVLAAGDRLDPAAYLRSLRSHRANSIRVWATEQWGAVPPSNSCATSAGGEGLTPFVGEWVTFDSHSYRLLEPNPDFYSNLREFAQAAADRGIVVFLSLFDKHGLLWRKRPEDGGTCWRGEWQTSPYNSANNNNGFLNLDWQHGTCSCGSSESFTPDVEDCFPPPHFVDHSNSSLDGINATFLARVAQEVGGIGNVMYEVVNEDVKGHDWPDANGDGHDDGEMWQLDVASKMRMQLPIFVARDAFNVRSCGISLGGTAADAGGGSWNTWTAFRDCGAQPDPETGIWMGHVRAFDPPRSWVLQGSLGLGTVGVRSGLSVRADVSRLQPNGAVMKLGFAQNGGQLWTNHVVVVADPWDTALSDSPYTLYVQKTVAGQGTSTLAMGTYDGQGPTINLRLDLNLRSPATATVYADSTAVFQGVPLQVDSAFLSALSSAFFSGERTSPALYFRPSDGEVDDFEADVFCDEFCNQL